VTVIPLNTRPDPNPSTSEHPIQAPGKIPAQPVAQSNPSQATQGFATLMPSAVLPHAKDAKRGLPETATPTGPAQKHSVTAKKATTLGISPEGAVPMVKSGGAHPSRHVAVASVERSGLLDRRSSAIGSLDGGKHLANPFPTEPQDTVPRNTATGGQPSTPSRTGVVGAKASDLAPRAASIAAASSTHARPSTPREGASGPVTRVTASVPGPQQNPTGPTKTESAPKGSDHSAVPTPTEYESENISAKAPATMRSTAGRSVVGDGPGPSVSRGVLQSEPGTSKPGHTQTDPSSATTSGRVPTSRLAADSSLGSLDPASPKAQATHSDLKFPGASSTDPASHGSLPTREHSVKASGTSIGAANDSSTSESASPTTSHASASDPSPRVPTPVGERSSVSLTSPLSGPPVRSHERAESAVETPVRSGPTREQTGATPMVSVNTSTVKSAEPPLVHPSIGLDQSSNITESSPSTVSQGSNQTVTSPRPGRENLSENGNAIPKAFAGPSEASVHAGPHAHSGSGMPTDHSIVTPTEPSTTTSPTTAGPAPTTASGHTPSDAMTMGPNAEWHVAQQQQPGQTILTAQHRQDAEPVRAEITDHTVTVMTPANGAPWQQSLDQHTATLQAALHQWGSGQQAHIQADVRGQSESQPRTPAGPSQSGPSPAGSRRAIEGLSESHSSYVEEEPLDSTIHWQSPA